MAIPEQDPVFKIYPPEPLPDAPPYVYHFYEAIGRFVLTWARLEQHVDDLERMALNIAARAEPEGEQMIIPLSPKLQAIKEVYKDCPDLSHNYEPVQQLMHEIGVLGQDRHIIVHSIFREFTDGPPPRIVLRHVTHRKGDMSVERGDYTADQIRTLTVEIAKLHDRLIPILRDAAERQDPEKLRKARLRDQSAGGNPPPIPL
jgi:hypothetical protein